MNEGKLASSVQDPDQEVSPNRRQALWEVLMVATKLGLTSFGGPTAHLGYFHNEYVRKRKWLDEQSYADLVGLCQFLPGPASSQVGIGIGVMRAGLLGGLMAWIGFTLPSVFVLIAFALLLKGADVSHAGWISGLKIVAVVIVAHAILGMTQKLTPDKERITLAVIIAAAALVWAAPYSQVILIMFAGIAGWAMYRKSPVTPAAKMNIPIRRGVAVLCLIVFAGLLVILPIVRHITNLEWIALFDSMYRAGSMVFGGGHVVLPLLQQELVPYGIVSKDDFLAGYGATQAVPGPLFTFAAYLGAVSMGGAGAFIATIAIFLPAFLLIIGALPFWSALRSNSHMQGALAGINAGVVGILLAALYQPLWTTAVLSPVDFALVCLLFVLLTFWKCPPWVIVLLGIVGGVAVN
ncbi:chromate transporter [Paenibacillus barcinonensis]|uniref:Chromate transporter n=1 Tax=Paenibacillus barcinonensis TaxID=198119 RepID=A0A2V4WCJ6_PAEBA|nr:chromate transporter [Paenibacillus barcinonensis]PYE49173.1 chromate transporter [Paenibacillus barcinonensis]QKS55409.1 chromate transporter [Paenibacillus barcinonensis]